MEVPPRQAGGAHHRQQKRHGSCGSVVKRWNNTSFDRYFRLRKHDADTLADLAVENFLEMRDRVASPWFRARKRWEKRLHRMFPRWYVPLYSMVTFSRMPYAQAVARAARQDLAVVGILFSLIILLVLGMLSWR